MVFDFFFHDNGGNEDNDDAVAVASFQVKNSTQTRAS